MDSGNPLASGGSAGTGAGAGGTAGVGTGGGGGASNPNGGTPGNGGSSSVVGVPDAGADLDAAEPPTGGGSSADAAAEAAPPVDPCAACDPAATCNAGALNPCACPQGYAGDGMKCTRKWCEPLTGSASVCGANTTCTETATAAKCACTTGHASCDGTSDPTKGCETDTTTDAKNCGICGFACAGNLGCASGKCDQVVSKISGALAATCVLLAADGHVKCWGNNYGGVVGLDPSIASVNAPIALTLPPLRDLAVGPSHACGVASSADKVQCWGDDSTFQLGTTGAVDPGKSVAVDFPGVAEVATSYYATCARTQAGAVRCWGAGRANGTGSDTPTASPTNIGIDDATALFGSSWGFCATHADHTASCWGPLLDATPALLEGGAIKDLVSMGVGSLGTSLYHFCYLHSGGLSCVGDNSVGQLGVGDFAAHGAPVKVTLPSKPVRLVTGGQHTCAVTATADLYCWGSNSAGQLGQPATAGEVVQGIRAFKSPTKVASNVLDVSANLGTTCIRKSTGQVQCFGHNQDGNVGDGTSVQRYTPTNVVGLP